MGRINEKTGLFIRNLLLFVQCNDTEYDSEALLPSELLDSLMLEAFADDDDEEEY